MFMKKILLNRAARIGLFLTAIASLLGSAPAAHAAAGNNNIKIIAWYGAGSLAGSEYGRDTIILFNPTQAAITMNGWSIQTGSTSGAFTAVTYKLPVVTIPAGGYYAIAGSGDSISATACVGANCNTHYAFDYQLLTIEGGASPTQNSLSSTAAVVALVDNQVPLGSGCPKTSPDLVDLIGIAAADGSALVTCWAGGGSAPYTPASLNGATTNIHGVKYAYATVRKNKCGDTFDNTNDWTLGYIDYENSATEPQVCPVGTQLSVTDAVATPNNPAVGASFTITAKVTPATGGTLQSVVADLSNLGLSATTQLYDDGTHGDAVAGDGTYSLTTAATSGSAGQKLGLIVTAKDNQNNTAINSIPFTLGGGNYPGPGNNNIKIIAWYGAGNLGKSEYARDTVILFNPTQRSITMNNWSLQTANNLGAFTAVSYKLPVATLPPGGYYAITGSGVNYGSGCISTHCNLNYPFDYQLKTIENTATDTDNDLSSTQVVVALVDNQTALGSDCPKNSAHVVDFVGIGAVDGSSPVFCYAGSGSASYTPTPFNGVTAANMSGIVYRYATVRKNKCGDTFDNANDWTLSYIDYKNSTDAPEPCAGGDTTVPGSQLMVTAASNPDSAGIADPITITATVTPRTGTPIQSVTADLANIGLSDSTQLYDDGTHGDAHAGDNIYSVATAATNNYYGMIGQMELNATATDTTGSKVTAPIPFTLLSGSFTLTADKTTATVKGGDVASFLLTLKSFHGYNGTLGITCTGTPNTNNLGVPLKTQCVTTPPEIVLGANGTVTANLAIATGTTFSAGLISRSLPMGLLAFLSLGLLSVAIWRRKHLPVAGLLALVMLLSMNTTGCGTNAGLGGTSAAPGVYTYTLTATDSNLSTVTNSLTFTVTVQ